MPLGLHHLRYVVAVAEEGNVTRAAARLRVAQPSLSTQIRAVERHVGTALFRRHPRGLELTPAGQMFLLEARLSLDAAERAVHAARAAARHDRGRLRIGFIVGTLVEPASSMVRAFRECHREVELEFAEYTFADPSAGLNRGEVDLAFLTLPVTHDGLHFEEILRVPRVAVLGEGHPLAGRNTLAVRELFDDPWIVAETADTRCRDFWLAMAHRDGVPPRLGPTTTSIDKFIQLAMTGQAVGLAATWVEQAFCRPGVCYVPVVDVEPVVTAVAWRPGPVHELVELFLATAHSSAAATLTVSPPSG